MMYGEQTVEIGSESGNGDVRNEGFLRPLISAYSTLPLHGMTAIPGKISGALMVVDSIEDAVPLIHGPIGCAFQRKINPFRPYLPFYETPCTDMNDVDVVYGGEDKLSLGIRETYEKYHPNLIVVITTCPSDLIGDDFKAVVEEIKAKGDVGCDVVYTTGDFVGKTKPVGYQDALFAITDQVLCNGIKREEIERNEESVNIVSFPIHGAGLKVAEMVSVLSEMGIKINKICFDHTTVKDLYDLPKAELTITDYPMAWARLMKERFGVDHYEILAWNRYKETRNPELFSPYGFEGSARVFMEIAQRFGKEAEAEEVIERRKKDATERLSKVKKGLEDKEVAIMGGIHGIGLTLLRDVGIKASVIIYKTQALESRLTSEAINEMLDINVELARKYGSDPEVLVNPTIEEELKAIKETETDLVISMGATAHKYNKEGIRTFNPMNFMLRHQRIGFEAPIELAMQLKEALKKPRKRNPLLSMLEYDPYRTNLIPEWATLADMFGSLRQGAVGDKDRYDSMYTI
jgi:nitrogenase molybdenum-cofactor synthesis protein NifE